MNIVGILLLVVEGALIGTRDITVHHYIQAGSQQYMACGMSGAEVDLFRVAAVNGLNTEVECGACLKVESGFDGTEPQYVMALDIVEVGLDLNEDTFQKLYNATTGRFTGSWNLAHPEYCKDISNEKTPQS
ncbi:hypothetical protein L0F63_000871 [Massospora cicadina]|nr:hypothetical protein L0F63_000871 [Massospora cicadina]